jgi:hypothetical protein
MKGKNELCAPPSKAAKNQPQMHTSKKIIRAKDAKEREVKLSFAVFMVFARPKSVFHLC